MGKAVDRATTSAVTLFLILYDSDVYMLYERVGRTVVESDLKRAKDNLLAYIQSHALPLIPAGQNTLKIDVEHLPDEQVREIVLEWL